MCLACSACRHQPPEHLGRRLALRHSFILGTIAINKKKGTATLNVDLPNPSDLTASGTGVQAASAGQAVISKSVSTGPRQILIKATGKQR